MQGVSMSETRARRCANQGLLYHIIPLSSLGTYRSDRGLVCLLIDTSIQYKIANLGANINKEGRKAWLKGLPI
ncbi:hypothetical protein B296_00020787 [Ensete ventricosum]|uniref:Uncharacterized protein n=1 Tax=Ensete ventricosum TaxID=4639 RepID=A0A427AXU1_ENSVE|nr:hypothetical protein B296_00020787 [Ensete ventricosum]